MEIRRSLRPWTRRVRLLPGRATWAKRPLPDFVIIGAQKAGTTSLFNYLGQHPDVRLPKWKEVHYFDFRFQLGPEWYRAHFPTASARGERGLSGESTPYYLIHPLAAKRMAATIPDVKLVVLLRNPVDRAYSHYKHEVDFQHESLPFDEAIDSEDDRLWGERERLIADGTYRSEAFRRHTYLARGRYAEQLENWFAHFGRDQFLIRDTETFHNDPQAVYSEVLRFLSLSEHQLPSFPRHFARSYSKMRQEARDRLVEYFRPHNERLYELLSTRFDWDR